MGYRLPIRIFQTLIEAYVFRENDLLLWGLRVVEPRRHVEHPFGNGGRQRCFKRKAAMEVTFNQHSVS